MANLAYQDTGYAYQSTGFAYQAGVTQAGAGKPKKDRKYIVKVDGKDYLFSSIDDLIYFLDNYEVKAEKALEKKAEKDAKRILRIGQAKAKAKPPEVRISSPVPEIREYVDEVQKKIDKLYWRALASALARDAEEVEDIQHIAAMILH